MNHSKQVDFVYWMRINGAALLALAFAATSVFAAENAAGMPLFAVTPPVPAVKAEEPLKDGTDGIEYQLATYELPSSNNPTTEKVQDVAYIRKDEMPDPVKLCYQDRNEPFCHFAKIAKIEPNYVRAKFCDDDPTLIEDLGKVDLQLGIKPEETCTWHFRSKSEYQSILQERQDRQTMTFIGRYAKKALNFIAPKSDSGAVDGSSAIGQGRFAP